MNYSNETLMAKIAINKSLLKEYQNCQECERVVYMKNGEEFQINLFNPNTFVIGAEIFVNSEQMQGKFVLKPGERVWIERYIDKAVKLKFSTYEVEDSSEVKKAIALNGLIEVKFYKEYKPSNISISNYTTPFKNNQIRYDKLLTNVDYSILNTNVNCIDQGICTNSIISASASNEDVVLNANATTLYSDTAPENSLELSLDLKSIETGRIEEGTYSSQRFDTVYNQFETWPFKTEKIMILPSSRKPISKNDLQKIYCTECGRKLNTKYKFCPYCGTPCI